MATRQLLLLLVLGPLLIGLSVIAFRAVPLPGSWLPWRDTLTGFLAAMMLVVYLVTLAGVVWQTAAGDPNRQITEITAALGLTTQQPDALGRRISGDWRGREATILFQPGGVTHHIIQVELTADSAEQAAAGRQRPSQACANCPRMTSDNPALQSLYLVAERPDWLADKLTDPATAAAVAGQGPARIGDNWFAAGPCPLGGRHPRRRRRSVGYNDAARLPGSGRYAARLSEIEVNVACLGPESAVWQTAVNPPPPAPFAPVARPNPGGSARCKS